MSVNVGFGWIHVPADSPQGPLVGALNCGCGGGVLQTVKGWFCWGCRGVAPESVGREKFEQEHAKCGGER
jgi:hypothetical protein